MALLNETNRWRLRAVAASALLLAGLIIAAQGIRALPEREPVAASRRVQRAQRDASEQLIAGAAASLAGAALLVIIIRSRRLAPLK